MANRHSTPPLPPAAIAERLRAHFGARPAPIELMAQRTDRERGKQARIEAAEALVELQAWNKAMRSKPHP